MVSEAAFRKHAPQMKANADRLRSRVNIKIKDVLDRSSADRADWRTRRAIDSARRYLASLGHVSINIPPDRLLVLLHTGLLPPTTKLTNPERQLRLAAESAFRPTPSRTPVYGAFNWSSPAGAAAAFGSDCWLRLKKDVAAKRCTYTARDSYHITLPYIPSLSDDVRRERLARELFDYQGAVELALDRFWTIQDVHTPDYIEAQVWGGVRFADIATIHIHADLRAQLEDELDRSFPIARAQVIKKRLETFT